MAHDKQLSLPYSVVGRSDVGRLIRELEALEAAMQRKTAQKDEKLLPTSRLLDDLSQQNKLNLLQPDDRAALKQFLEQVRKDAPQLHFNFSTDPSPRFMASLVGWVRQEIHPAALLQIGLEPALGAGCTLRTTNRYFDFSLRHYFDNQRELLLSKMKGGA